MKSSEFATLLADCGYTVRSYSGRGNASCVAVVSGSSPFKIAAKLFLGTLEEDEDTLCRILLSARSDSMGLSTVHYFPRAVWDDECEEFEAEGEEY